MATSETNHTQTTVQQMTRNIQSRDTRFHVHHGGAMSLSWLQFIAAWRRHAHTHTHTHTDTQSCDMSDHPRRARAMQLYVIRPLPTSATTKSNKRDSNPAISHPGSNLRSARAPSRHCPIHGTACMQWTVISSPRQHQRSIIHTQL